MRNTTGYNSDGIVSDYAETTATGLTEGDVAIRYLRGKRQGQPPNRQT
jgi:hypothetical protein